MTVHSDFSRSLNSIEMHACGRYIYRIGGRTFQGIDMAVTGVYAFLRLLFLVIKEWSILVFYLVTFLVFIYGYLLPSLNT